MSKGIRNMAFGMLALVLAGVAWAGGNKSADTNTTPGAGQNTNGATAGASTGLSLNGNGKGTGNDSGQSESTGTPGSKGKDQASQHKQARAARHADIDKARQQAFDSLRAAFTAREAAEVAGSSESVNERLKSEANPKGSTK